MSWDSRPCLHWRGALWRSFPCTTMACVCIALSCRATIWTVVNYYSSALWPDTLDSVQSAHSTPVLLLCTQWLWCKLCLQGILWKVVCKVGRCAMQMVAPCSCRMAKELNGLNGCGHAQGPALQTPLTVGPRSTVWALQYMIALGSCMRAVSCTELQWDSAL